MAFKLLDASVQRVGNNIKMNVVVHDLPSIAQMTLALVQKLDSEKLMERESVSRCNVA